MMTRQWVSAVFRFAVLSCGCSSNNLPDGGQGGGTGTGGGATADAGPDLLLTGFCGEFTSNHCERGARCFVRHAGGDVGPLLADIYGQGSADRKQSKQHPLQA